MGFWDSGIIVYATQGLYCPATDSAEKTLVLKESDEGVYLVDPEQKGSPVVKRFDAIRFAEADSGKNALRRSRVLPSMAGAAIAGLPGALWLGLRGPDRKDAWFLIIRETDGTFNKLRCRNKTDALEMEKRMQRHVTTR